MRKSTACITQVTWELLPQRPLGTGGLRRRKGPSPRTRESCRSTTGRCWGGAATSAASVPVMAIPWTGEPNLRSMEFDGNSGSAVTWDTHGSEVLDVGSNDFTLEAWIAPRNADDFGLIAGKLVSGAFNDHGYDLHVRPSGDQPGAANYRVKFEARDSEWRGRRRGCRFFDHQRKPAI